MNSCDVFFRLLALLLSYRLIEGEICDCQNNIAKSNRSRTDGAFTGRFYQVGCCLNSRKDVNTLWFVNGTVPLPNWKISSLYHTSCNGQVLWSKGMRITDAGNYSCIIVNNDNTRNDTWSLQLRTAFADPYTKVPEGASIIPTQVVALIGDSVTLQCRGYIGIQPSIGIPGKISWAIEGNGAEFRELYEGDGVELGSTMFRKGVIWQNLTIPKVRSSHYGRFRCQLENFYSQENEKTFVLATLEEGVEETQYWIKTYNACLLLILGIAVLWISLFCIWVKCSYSLRLCFHRRNKDNKTDENYLWDVFIIHGNTSREWVWTEFIPRLQTTLRMRCFVYERDCLAGEVLLTNSLASHVSKSRCILLVITQCLFENPFNSWTVHQSLHAAAKSNTRIIGVVIQTIPSQPGSFRKRGLHSFLLAIPKIKYPLPIVDKEEKTQRIGSMYRDCCFFINPEDHFWDTLRLQLPNPVIPANSNGFNSQRIGELVTSQAPNVEM